MADEIRGHYGKDTVKVVLDAQIRVAIRIVSETGELTREEIAAQTERTLRDLGFQARVLP